MDIALIFIAFLVAALIFWAVAELRYKNFNYKEDVPHHPDPTAHQGGEYVEQSVNDIMRENSTNGYLSID
ncbi:MAG: hypothetical protein HG458_001845 [Prevotella sp.]|nr:hypothetical protein [Prevotella sp.]